MRIRRRYWARRWRMRCRAPRSALGLPCAMAARQARYRPAASGFAVGLAPPATRRGRRRGACSAVPAASIMAASRGCPPIRAMSRPVAVMPPGRQARRDRAAARRQRRARRPAAGPGTANRPARCPRRRIPAPGRTVRPPGFPAGRRRAGPGAALGTRARIATPGASRPARPARWSAAARRDADSGQPGQAGRRVEARRAAPAAVDHDADARDGQRGLGDGGGQHDAACVGRAQRAVLLGGRQIAVQRQDKRAAALQRGLGAADFRHAGEEGEDVAVMLRPVRRGWLGRRRRAGRGMGDVARWRARSVDRENAAGAFDDVRVASAPDRRAPSAVADIASRRRSGRSMRCRSRHKASAEVGFERAFMDFVQDHGRDAVQPGIGLQAAEQQALGDDLDAGFGGSSAVEAGAVADGAADWLTQQDWPCAWPRRGWRGGAVPASGSGRRRARERRAGRAGRASSCRRRAARRARRCGRRRVPRDAGRASVTGRVGSGGTGSGEYHARAAGQSHVAPIHRDLASTRPERSRR